MKRTLPLLLAAMAVASATARKIADFFVEAPMYEAAPYLDSNMRMDLLDYFRSNLPSKTTNMFGENASVVSESERSLLVNAGKGVELEYGLAVSGRDSLLVVIETLPTPMPDSKVSLFGTGWNVARQASVMPAPADWLTDEGRANIERVELTVPFITASAKFVEDGNMLVFTNTIGKYYTDKDSTASEVARYLKPQITYRFNGKTFVPAK